MNEYWVVTDSKTGKIIAHCGEEKDAIMMLLYGNRTCRKQKFIADQIIDISSTTDKQLPGQLGLPSAKEKLPPIELQQQVWLPEGQSEPVDLS